MNVSKNIIEQVLLADPRISKCCMSNTFVVYCDVGMENIYLLHAYLINSAVATHELFLLFFSAVST